MQTQKARNGSPDVPKKTSPRAARLLKLESESSSSPVSANNKTPKDKSPKVLDRRSPVSERKRPSRITELELLVSQLQEDLKKAKEQAETSKKQAEEEAEEFKKQLKLKETQGVSETDNINGVIAHEIRELKAQIELVASSEAGHVKQAELRNLEVQLLRGNLMDTLFLVENFKNQLKDCEVTEAETEALATETLRQLENARKAVEDLKSDGNKVVESYKKMAKELEESKARMVWLESLVSKSLTNPEALGYEKEEMSTLRCEVERLRSALEEASDREGEIEELKERLVEKETELMSVSEELKAMKREKETEMKRVSEVVENLKADMMDKETEFQNILDENETMKLDKEDAVMKLKIAMEEAEKSSKRAVRVTEQLEATQASNSEMETELRKLKVQSNQWRKAAEAATAMLSAGNNGSYKETDSPYLEDVDDDLTKKKNGNVLKKIGVLWKKPQK